MLPCGVWKCKRRSPLFRGYLPLANYPPGLAQTDQLMILPCTFVPRLGQCRVPNKTSLLVCNCFRNDCLKSAVHSHAQVTDRVRSHHHNHNREKQPHIPELTRATVWRKYPVAANSPENPIQFIARPLHQEGISTRTNEFGKRTNPPPCEERQTLMKSVQSD